MCQSATANVFFARILFVSLPVSVSLTVTVPTTQCFFFKVKLPMMATEARVMDSANDPRGDFRVPVDLASGRRG